ncbi:MAG TPA: FAD-dependent oxidoreductase [Clostridia bacterium]|nr:FAD-dependent oxidoreductase [Clostridia bacterium]
MARTLKEVGTVEKSNVETITTDVLIIGGGAAGCMAAIEAAKAGVRVCIVDKGRVGRGGSSPTSGAGIAVVYDQENSDVGDNVETHLMDTINGGENLNDQFLASVMVEDGCKLIPLMEEWGIDFFRHPTSRDYLRYQLLGHSKPRGYYGVGSGPVMMEVLRKEAMHRRAKVMEQIMITKIFIKDNKVCGALGIDVEKEKILLFKMNAVILCTGSAVGLYKYASANFKTMGDGFGLAYDLGCEFGNMEFVEFTLIAKVGEKVISSAGISPFIGLGVHFINKNGERFLDRYDPERMERTTRARLVQAVYKENQDGNGPVLNDPRPVPEEVWDAREKQEGNDQLMGRLKAVGVNFRKENFEWVPAAHTFLGGVVIGKDCQSPDVSGLFAAGEVATGFHGANRLSANALTECLVFGKRAGTYASRYSLDNDTASLDRDQVESEVDKILGMVDEKGLSSKEVFGFTQKLQKMAWDKIAVTRNDKNLNDAITWLESEKTSATKVKKWGDIRHLMELKNLYLVAEMIARCSLLRKESRGQYLREDYPQRDDAFLKWTVLKNVNGKMVFDSKVDGIGKGGE